MSPERRYTEEEMRAVFARAAERQRRAEETGRASGLSLAEMQEVAAASGIDPTHVAAAVAELAAAPEPRRTVLGAPVEVTRVRHLPAPVSDEAWARIVGELRRTFNDDGMAGQLGRIREWSAVGRGHRRDVATRLALEPEGDGARVTLRRSTRDVALGASIAGAAHALIAVVFTVFGIAGSDADLLGAAALLGGLAIVLLGGLQLGLRLWANRQERQFEALLDRVELIAREDAATDEAAALPEGRPPLDLDHRPASAEASEPARRSRTRT
ncbi:MAG: hypothetical protein R3181_09015 [Rubricoccaceae bacterium]|nr:hypothetical protein [Rubricoccaceae bacterium]